MDLPLRWLALPVAVAAFLATTGCGEKTFDGTFAEIRIEAQPIKLDSEQVVLTDAQVDCGAENDLWEMPVTTGEHSVARLMAKGRELKFSDDVIVRDPGSPKPYAQVRGDFQVDLLQPAEIRDENGAKIVTAHVSVVVPHACFAAPLPLMGVRKGQFMPDAPPILHYMQVGDDWQFDRVVH